jgi:hypothetical protein
VHVKVIGTRNGDFVSGETDLRGVFVADSIQGTSTVIAQSDGDRYAFFRGQTQLGAPPAPPTPSAQAKGQQAAGSTWGRQSDLLENLKSSNSAILMEQQQQLKHFYDNKDQGVKAKAAF